MGIGERRKPFVETKFFLLSPNPFPLSQKTFGTFCGRSTKIFNLFFKIPLGNVEKRHILKSRKLLLVGTGWISPRTALHKPEFFSLGYRAALVGLPRRNEMKPGAVCGAYATVPAFTFRWLGTGNKGMFPNRRFCYRKL